MSCLFFNRLNLVFSFYTGFPINLYLCFSWVEEYFPCPALVVLYSHYNFFSLFFHCFQMESSNIAPRLYPYLTSPLNLDVPHCSLLFKQRWQTRGHDVWQLWLAGKHSRRFVLENENLFYLQQKYLMEQIHLLLSYLTNSWKYWTYSTSLLIQLLCRSSGILPKNQCYEAETEK